MTWRSVPRSSGAEQRVGSLQLEARPMSWLVTRKIRLRARSTPSGAERRRLPARWEISSEAAWMPSRIRRGAPGAAAAKAPLKARHVIGDNAALIAGLGIAIGGIIAAAFPETRAEAKAMGRASD